jgi:hypothetical protein
VKRPEHLKFIRRLPCIICGRVPSQAAHIRYSSAKWGKANAMSAKPDDMWTVPLCPKHHSKQHAFGAERKWWRLQGVDPHQLAYDLFEVTGNYAAGVEVVRDTYLRIVI